MKSGKYFFYRAYELNIKSELYLPWFIALDNNYSGKLDLFILFGKMSDSIKKEIQHGIKWRYKKDDMWFLIEEVAIFRIHNFNTITIETFENYNEDHLKIYLNASAIGLLLLQRNEVAIHGSTLVIDGNAIIFTGDSGAGKSTLSVALRLKGYPFLSDDISVTQKGSENNILVKPGFPMQRLCSDTMKLMGFDTSNFIKVNDEKDKYALPVHDGYINNPVSLKAIFELSFGDVEEVQISQVTGSKKMVQLIKNIYLTDALPYIENKTAYFKKCIDIASKIKFYKLIRPKNLFSIDEQITKILETLRE